MLQNALIANNLILLRLVFISCFFMIMDTTLIFLHLAIISQFSCVYTQFNIAPGDGRRKKGVTSSGLRGTLIRWKYQDPYSRLLVPLRNGSAGAEGCDRSRSHEKFTDVRQAHKK